MPLPLEPNAPFELRNGHLQTILSALLRPSDEPYDQAEWLTLRDGDRIRLYTGRREDAPLRGTVLLLHGLEGNAQSPTVKRLAVRLRRRGFAVIAAEYRGCSGELNRAPRLYFSGDSEELTDMVTLLRDRRQGRPFFVAGCSLGANLLLKWLGEQGDQAPIDGAAALSPPFDLVATGPHLDRTARGFYSRHFLRTLVPKALEKARQYPGLIDYVGLSGCRTIVRYDDLVTAPLHGFDGVWDYYARCSSGPLVEAIRCPTLIVASEDDPINPAETIPKRALASNPAISDVVSKRGGHLGFFRRVAPFSYASWAEEQTVEFFVSRAAEWE